LNTCQKRLRYQNAPYQSAPLFYCQNCTFNNVFLHKRWYHLSSKFIYCIYIFILHWSDDNELVYIRSGNCVYKYIKLTYILGNICFVLLWLSSIFAENFISLQLVSYSFFFIFLWQ
jgi:hypothetical protein